MRILGTSSHGVSHLDETEGSSRGDRHADALLQQKRRLRTAMRRRRAAAVKLAESSRRIHERLIELPEFAAARNVCIYVSTAMEVDTQGLIERAWQDGKTVAVPYCGVHELELFELRAWSELSPGVLGILEPHDALRAVAGRHIAAEQVDLFLVPGLAFDRLGRRLGHGKGYYDRLLVRATAGVPKVALAFGWQLVDKVPAGPTDITMDLVVTEQEVRVAPS